ncbi:retinol dehydrogenase 13 [Procambarus clarkii]|uniref:retinol dehydrogenase 13 n=1 Tax=Procambarus clarkii TaxID=6728 RepID=UPI0037420DF0
MAVVTIKMIKLFVAYLESGIRFTVDAGVALLKQWLKLDTPIKCHCQNRVRGKVVIVTGSNSGIGNSTALDLARKGATVYLACRSCKAGEAAARTLSKATGNLHVHFLHLDLTDFSSIQLFAQEFMKCEQRLDVLVNNAAIFHHPPILTCDELDITYQTNYLGVFLLTTLLLNVIQRSTTPKIIFVSSESHKLVSLEDLSLFSPRQSRELKTFADHVKIYGLSKLALHLFAQYLTLTQPGVQVTLVDPGNVWTKIYRHSWQLWSEIFTRLKCYIYMRSPEEGAESTIHALNAPHIASGQYIDSNLNIEIKENYDCEVVNQFIAKCAALVDLPRISPSFHLQQLTPSDC